MSTFQKNDVLRNKIICFTLSVRSTLYSTICPFFFILNFDYFNYYKHVTNYNWQSIYKMDYSIWDKRFLFMSPVLLEKSPLSYYNFNICICLLVGQLKEIKFNWFACQFQITRENPFHCIFYFLAQTIYLPHQNFKW